MSITIIDPNAPRDPRAEASPHFKMHANSIFGPIYVFHPAMITDRCAPAFPIGKEIEITSGALDALDMNGCVVALVQHAQRLLAPGEGRRGEIVSKFPFDGGVALVRTEPRASITKVLLPSED